MKLFKIFLLVFLLFGLASCGDDSAGTNDDDRKDDVEISDNGVNSKDDTEVTENDANSTDDTEMPENDADSTDDTEVADNDADDSGLTPEMEAKYEQADLYAENVSPELVAANTKLAVKLFSELNSEGENIMISPLSVSIAMAMALNGAAGDNFDEMKTVLEYDSMTMEDINTSFYNLINSLVEADKDMTLSIADSIWMYDEFIENFYQNYIDVLSDKYDAEPYVIDFFSDTALGEINGWVSEKTNGKIKNMLDEISPNAVMFLINAVYFNSKWAVAFDSEDTYKSYFTKSDGEKIKVDFMNFKNQDFQYHSPGTYRTVKLPYGRGKFSFYGIIPPEDKTIDELITDISENGVDKYLENLSEKTIDVVLPKFKFEDTEDLVNVFSALGMSKAFSKNAQYGGFGNIADIGDEFYITKIAHKTFIEVNEEGTEAAAATAIEVGDTGEPSDPPGFYGTKPFIYIIRDDRSGTILFMGKVEDPTVEK